MKLFLLPARRAGLAAFLCASSALFAAEAAPDAAGYWEGSITLPAARLEIRVETKRDGDAWTGTIDMPTQGLRGFKLDPVEIKDGAVTLGLPGAPGEPRFVGRLSADGRSLAGDFQQGGGTFPFTLERKPRPAAAVEKPGLPGKGFVGFWLGALKPVPGVELQLSLDVMRAGPDGGEAMLISLSQNNSRLLLTVLSEKDGDVRFEATPIGSRFTGKLNADGSEVAGHWEQGGRSTPLVFRRSAKPLPEGAAGPQPRKQ